MIILDTNVISEPLRPTPDQIVIDWLDGQISETLFTTSITIAELLTGVAVLPEGRRKTALRSHLQGTIENLFKDRILPFSTADAVMHATVVALTKSIGFNISFADAQIAAIAKSHRMIIATRDASPFEAAGLETINPWNTKRERATQSPNEQSS